MTLHIRRIKNPFKFLFFPFLPNSTFTWIARLEIVHNSDRFSKTRSYLTSCLGTNSRFCSALANWVRFHVYQNSWLACRAQSLSINISGVLCFNFRYRNWIRNKNKACGFFASAKKPWGIKTFELPLFQKSESWSYTVYLHANSSFFGYLLKCGCAGVWKMRERGNKGQTNEIWSGKKVKKKQNCEGRKRDSQCFCCWILKKDRMHATWIKNFDNPSRTTCSSAAVKSLKCAKLVSAAGGSNRELSKYAQYAESP